jgi:hypothetical protein
MMAGHVPWSGGGAVGDGKPFDGGFVGLGELHTGPVGERST